MALDVGCGLSKLSGFIGVDVDGSVKPDVVCSADDLMFGSGVCGYVYSRRCVQHVFDDVKCLREFYRVLECGGVVELVVSSWLGWLYYKLGLSASCGRYKVFHCYSLRRVVGLVKDAGFVVHSAERVGTRWFGFDYRVVGVKV